jgi:hypothetical protein
MEHRSRNPKSHHRYGPHQDAAVQRLTEAAQRAEVDDTPTARDALRCAVDEARATGVGWTRIGDILGIASGNAYQRYRKRPGSADQRCEAGESHG